MGYAWSSPRISCCALAKTGGFAIFRSISGSVPACKILVAVINLSGYIFTLAAILSTSVNPSSILVMKLTALPLPVLVSRPPISLPRLTIS